MIGRGHLPNAPLVERVFRRTVRAGDCLEWAGSRTNGYGSIDDHGRKRLTHRVAWEAQHGPVPPGMCVLHRCDNRVCVEVGHLFLGTKRDNTQDMLRKGRGRWGPNRARRMG